MAEKRIIEETASTELFNDDWFIKDSALQGTTKISQSKLKELMLDGTMTLADLASASVWTTNTYYDRDSVVYHEGKLYRNLSGKYLHEATFSTDDWTEIQSDFVSFINKLENSMASGWMNTQTYYPGDYAFYNGHYYRCVSTTTAGTWQSNKWMQTSLHSEIIQYLWKFAQYMVISDQSTRAPYAKGELAIRSIDHVDHLLMAKDDYPQGVTSFDPDQWIDLSVDDEEWISGLSKTLVGMIDDVSSDIPTDASGLSYDNTDSGLEAENVQDAIDEVVERVEDIESQEENWTMIGSAEGLPADIATFKDGTDNPLKSLTASIVPVQAGSGDPSPTNVRPISGWTEEVITVSPLNISLYNGQIYGDGIWVPSDMRLTNASSEQDNSYFLKAGTHTLDYDKLNPNAPNLLQCSVLTKDDNYTIIDNFASEWNGLPFTFTLTQDGYLYFTVRKDANTNVNPSDYKAKILGHTTTIPFTDAQGNPVEVFGGSVDVVNGGEQPRTLGKIIFDGSDDEVWSKSTNAFYIPLNELVKKTSYTIEQIKCDKLKTVSNFMSIVNGTELDSISAYSDASVYVGQNWLYIGISGVSTVEALRTWLASNNVTVVYELATPTTFYTQPTSIKSLDGVNNVFASTGDVEECEYTRDATTVINDLIARIEALENA